MFPTQYFAHRPPSPTTLLHDIWTPRPGLRPASLAQLIPDHAQAQHVKAARRVTQKERMLRS